MSHYWDAPDIPSSIGQLSNLQELYLNNNRIEAIPDFGKEFFNLQRLGLSDNQISEIPNHVRQITDLRQLNLSHNPIADIPEWIRQFERRQETADLNVNLMFEIESKSLWVGESS